MGLGIMGLGMWIDRRERPIIHQRERKGEAGRPE